MARCAREPNDRAHRDAEHTPSGPNRRPPRPETRGAAPEQSPMDPGGHRGLPSRTWQRAVHAAYAPPCSRPPWCPAARAARPTRGSRLRSPVSSWPSRRFRRMGRTVL